MSGDDDLGLTPLQRNIAAVVGHLFAGVPIAGMYAVERAAPERHQLRDGYHRRPHFIKRMLEVLKQELQAPLRLAELYQLGIHEGGRIGKDPAESEWAERRRRRRMSHWTSCIQLLASMTLMTDARSLQIGTPIGTQRLAPRSWLDVFGATFGACVDQVLGRSRMDRATKLLRRTGWLDVFQVRTTEDAGASFQSKAAYKRLTGKFIAALGLAREHKDLRAAESKHARKKARQQGQQPDLPLASAGSSAVQPPRQPGPPAAGSTPATKPERPPVPPPTPPPEIRALGAAQGDDSQLRRMDERLYAEFIAEHGRTPNASEFAEYARLVARRRFLATA